MSEEAKPAKKKGKGKLFMLIGIALLVAGGGAAGGFYAAGAFTKDEGPKDDPNKPVLVPKGQTAEDVAAAHGGGEGGHAEEGAAGHDDKPSKGVDLPSPKNTSADRKSVV
jgi:flagellar FliL protein